MCWQGIAFHYFLLALYLMLFMAAQAFNIADPTFFALSPMTFISSSIFMGCLPPSQFLPGDPRTRLFFISVVTYHYWWLNWCLVDSKRPPGDFRAIWAIPKKGIGNK